MDQHIESEHAAKMLSIEEEGIKNIQEKFRCKITVLRRAFYEDLYRQAPYGAASACGRLKEGQVFITNSRWILPKGYAIGHGGICYHRFTVSMRVILYQPLDVVQMDCALLHSS